MSKWKATGDYNDVEEAIECISGQSYEELMHPQHIACADLENIADAAALIMDSIDKDMPITIIGDYDVDGITATAILYKALSILGGSVDTIIPRRFSDGYGISKEMVANAKEGLIITVDNGITAPEEIAYARHIGNRVIVIDHHLPGETLPLPNILIDPHVHPEYNAFVDYCGAGLAYKLSRYLLAKYEPKQGSYTLSDNGEESAADALGCDLLALACIATMADVVPLIGDNRRIVLDGLHVINEQRNALSPGVRAVVNSVKAEHIEAETIAYCISPMLNAPGRLYNAGSTSTLKAVLCEDDLQSKEYVKKMCSINTERKRVVVEWMEKLQAEAAKAVEKGQVMPLVLYASGIPEGIVGIVTGKLAEEYKTPTFVLSDSDETDILKGSGRSYGGINLKQLLDSTAEYLIEYGGHKAAAGIKVHKSQYSKMTKAMREALNDCGKGYDDTIFYNMVIDPEEIPAILNTMKRFEPFGEGVPKPVFVLTGFTPTAQNGCFYRTMGSNKEHIKFFGNGFDVVAFNMSGKYADMDYPTQMDFLGTIGENTFNGTTTIQFNVIDYRKS